MNKPIFILGLPRSGSTLWLNLFKKHPEIFRFSGEMLYLTMPFRRDFRYFLRRYGGGLTEKSDVDRIVDLMFAMKSVPGLAGSFWKLDIKPLSDDSQFLRRLKDAMWQSDRSLSGIFRVTLEEITRRMGYMRFCAKFPVHLNWLPELLDWYPDAKIVHVIRDPRAIAASRQNDPGGTQVRVRQHPRMATLIRKLTMAMSVAQYIWASRIHRRYVALPNYAVFRFETLLLNPEREVSLLCEFTESSFDPSMLHPEEGSGLLDCAHH